MTKFVIEHAGIGRFVRGDVVSEDQLTRDGMDVARLIGLRAMRLATGLECELTHVDLPGTTRDTSFQHQLAEKENEILLLRARISELEQANTVHARPASLPQSVNQGEVRLIEEKDRMIHSLQAQLQNARQGNLGRRPEPEVPQEQPVPPAPTPPAAGTMEPRYAPTGPKTVSVSPAKTPPAPPA